jgi:hypothetical protein
MGKIFRIIGMVLKKTKLLILMITLTSSLMGCQTINSPKVKTDTVAVKTAVTKPVSNLDKNGFIKIPDNIYYKKYRNNGFEVETDIPTFLTESTFKNGYTRPTPNGGDNTVFKVDDDNCQTFSNKDDTVTVQINMYNQVVDSYGRSPENFEQQLNDIKKHCVPGQLIAYGNSEDYHGQWITSSSIDGAGYIKYCKSFIGKGHQVNISISYLKTNKIKMDPVVDDIVKSFLARDLDCLYSHNDNYIINTN